MRRKTTGPKIHCSECGKGTLRRKLIDHDVGAFIDMKKVFVEGLPALVCTSCGGISLEGSVIEAIMLLLAVDILQRPALSSGEVRYLRKLVGDTQDEFAVRLGVNRITVNRWENDSGDVKGPDAYAIRSHTFFRLRDRSPLIEAVAPAFTSEHPPAQRSKRKPYSLKGSDIRNAA